MDGRNLNLSPDELNRYANRLFAKKDYAGAVRFYIKAAELGSAKAQFNLGMCYGRGCGVEKNIPEALCWLRIAANQGDTEAAKLVELLEKQAPAAQNPVLTLERQAEMLCKRGNAHVKNKAYSEAAECYRGAAEAGNAEGMYCLGMCLGRGLGVEKNIPEASDWLRKAAQLGNRNAKSVIEQLDKVTAEQKAKADEEQKAESEDEARTDSSPAGAGLVTDIIE